MSISASGSNYMSNATIMEWMETKTDDLYGKMRNAMDTSNSRVAAEDAMNDIKGKLDQLAKSGADARPLLDEINQTIKTYGADFTEVADALQPIADKLAAQVESNRYKLGAPANLNRLGGQRSGSIPDPKPATNQNSPRDDAMLDLSLGPPPIKVDKGDAESWAKQITDRVETLGKQDQLGLIQLQEFNSQLNRAKETASALMAAADKAADNTIAHIA